VFGLDTAFAITEAATLGQGREIIFRSGMGVMAIPMTPGERHTASAEVLLKNVISASLCLLGEQLRIDERDHRGCLVGRAPRYRGLEESLA
jgi:hypothetical protein